MSELDSIPEVNHAEAVKHLGEAALNVQKVIEGCDGIDAAVPVRDAGRRCLIAIFTDIELRLTRTVVVQ
jgi:hypothetical protein